MSFANEVEKTTDDYSNGEKTSQPFGVSRRDWRTTCNEPGRRGTSPPWAWKNASFDWMDWHTPFDVTE
ncbi:hypothetical protein B0G75_115167 [Paraburkholderia sp. BL18I3N2]|nr:hypothetical protein B0G75_115167 [Paraburkholderia sp. BL18I3N2]